MASAQQVAQAQNMTNAWSSNAMAVRWRNRFASMISKLSVPKAESRKHREEANKEPEGECLGGFVHCINGRPRRPQGITLS
jgi:hypothetical protein